MKFFTEQQGLEAMKGVLALLPTKLKAEIIEVSHYSVTLPMLKSARSATTLVLGVSGRSTYGLPSLPSDRKWNALKFRGRDLRVGGGHTARFLRRKDGTFNLKGIAKRFVEAHEETVRSEEAHKRHKTEARKNTKAARALAERLSSVEHTPDEIGMSGGVIEFGGFRPLSQVKINTQGGMNGKPTFVHHVSGEFSFWNLDPDRAVELTRALYKLAHEFGEQ